jgi:hypothetical protein
MFVVVQPDFCEPGRVGGEGVHLGAETAGNGVGRAVAVNVTDLEIKFRLKSQKVKNPKDRELKIYYSRGKPNQKLA